MVPSPAMTTDDNTPLHDTRSDSGIQLTVSESLDKLAKISTDTEPSGTGPKGTTHSVGAKYTNILWVPAHKHPEIAPSEFAIWIQTSGSVPVEKAAKVKRQKSKLSRSVSYDDTPDEMVATANTTTDTTTDTTIDTTADTAAHATVSDLSVAMPGLPPRRELFRRSAVSARKTNADKNERRRTRRTSTWRHSTDIHDRLGQVPEGGIHLYDQSVSMSEWIDLGSASLKPSQHGILSRVQDAESELFTKMNDNDTQSSPPSVSPDKGNGPDPPELRKDVQDMPRRSLSLDSMAKTSQKSSWLTSLLHRNDKTEPQGTKPRQRKSSFSWMNSTPAVPSKKTGFTAFLSRSLSLRPSTSSSSKEAAGLMKAREALPRVASKPASAHKLVIHSYRLPIHIERAVYKLSHLKLADPRRSLHQQVVISNLMFWYLSIIQHQYQNNNSNTPAGEPTHEQSSPTPASRSPRRDNRWPSGKVTQYDIAVPRRTASQTISSDSAWRTLREQ